MLMNWELVSLSATFFRIEPVPFEAVCFYQVSVVQLFQDKMFRNYQELIVGYAAFYSNELYSDRSISKIPQPDGLIDAAPTINGKAIVDACSPTIPNQQRVTETEECSLQITSTGCQTGSVRDDISSINSIGIPDIGSKKLDEYGSEIVIGSFNSLSLVDFFYILTLLLSFIVAKRHLSKSISSSVSIIKHFQSDRWEAY